MKPFGLTECGYQLSNIKLQTFLSLTQDTGGHIQKHPKGKYEDVVLLSQALHIISLDFELDLWNLNKDLYVTGKTTTKKEHVFIVN